MNQNEIEHTPKFSPSIPAHQGDALPLVVWLKGDEPFFDEFYLDAEDAMAILDIKRTRLTQISGREIRVGRVKSGRYIKPKYRKSDLESYLNHTRAPATHQKAALLSAKIDSTLDGWDERLKALQSSLINYFQHDLKDLIRSEHDSSLKQIELISDFVNKKIHFSLEKFYRDLTLWLRTYHSLNDLESSQIIKQQDAFLERLSNLELQMGPLTELHKISHEQLAFLKALDKKVGKEFPSLFERFTTLEKSLVSQANDIKKPRLKVPPLLTKARIQKEQDIKTFDRNRRSSLKPPRPYKPR